MGHHSEAFVGIDTSKLKNAIVVAEAGRDGEVRQLGDIDTTDAATREMVAKLAAKYEKRMSARPAAVEGVVEQGADAGAVDRAGVPVGVLDGDVGGAVEIGLAHA